MPGPVRTYITGPQNRSTSSDPYSRSKPSHERSLYRQALNKKSILARIRTNTTANQPHDSSAFDFSRSSSQVDLFDLKYDAVDRAKSRQGSICSASSWTFNTPVSNWNAWREELKRYDFEHFLAGTILLAFHFEQHSGKYDATDRRTMSALHNAPDVIHKMRPMIIVSQHARSYVRVPMFTHNGRGLDRKPNKDEYVSIYDPRLNDYVAEKNGLSCHRPLIAKIDPESKCLNGVSCAFLAYPVSYHYNAPIAMIGRLEKDSTKRLLRLY